MPNIYQYMNYRDFLLDYYNERKSKNSAFSYQLFANKAGFKSKSFIKLVIDGKKNLSKESTVRLNKVLQLESKAFSYFEDLIAFNQAESLKLRNYFFERLIAYNKRNPARLVLRQQYEFYAKWYHNTIRELVTLYDFKDNYALIGKLVKPQLSEKQVKDSIKLLLELSLIKKTKEGYQQTSSLITTGDEVKSLAVQNFHTQNLELAAKAIDTIPAEKRDISCLVLGLSSNGSEKVKKEIQNFRKKLLEIAQQDEAMTGVYHVNFQFFPTSKEIS